MPLKVSIDSNLCEAHGRCYNYAEAVFERGDKGKARIILATIDDDDLDNQLAARSASMMCPVGAITVEEE